MSEASCYPFTAIVGQADMKNALLLAVVYPAIGGVLIEGERGTAKSTAVRALPSIAPDRRVVELPLGATEDRVVGTLDIERALRTGEKHFDPGVLARADGNILYVDEVNLLDDHIVDLLLDCAAMGVNYIEREGISYSHPARFILVGTMNPEEGELRPQLLDRFGLAVEVRAAEGVEERVEVVRRRLSFESDPDAFCRKFAEDEARLRAGVQAARDFLPSVEVPGDILAMVAAGCAALGVEGHRADIALVKAATGFAALRGSSIVERADVLAGVPMALRHRAKGASPWGEAIDRDGLLAAFAEGATA